MKVIFLDIDGVLNHEKFYVERFECNDDWVFPEYPFNDIDLECVNILNEILEVTDAKIVVSSTWRFSNNYKEELYSVGLKPNIILGRTKYLYEENEDGSSNHLDRGYEIQDYLNNHEEIINYVIIDDDSDMLEHQLPYFVQTSRWDGLNEECKTKIIKILNG